MTAHAPTPRVALTGVPVLTTARLTLRAPAPSDFEPFAAFFATDRSRFTGGPMTRELSWRAFCHLTGHWVHRGYGPFVIETPDGRPIGYTGPYFPEGWPEPEIAWTLWDPSAEGKGHALEAATEARRFARQALGWTAPISMIDPANDRSIALARRLGCRPDGTFVHERFGLCHLWRHPHPNPHPETA